MRIDIKFKDCELVSANESGEKITESGIEISFYVGKEIIYTDYLDSMSRYCQYDRCLVIAGFAEAYAEYTVHSIQKLDNVRVWSIVLQVAAMFENNLNDFLAQK